MVMVRTAAVPPDGSGPVPICFKWARLHSLRKNSILHLILGGPAVYRCGKWIVLNTALAAGGRTFCSKLVFPQPLQSCRKCRIISSGFSHWGNASSKLSHYGPDSVDCCIGRVLH